MPKVHDDAKEACEVGDEDEPRRQQKMIEMCRNCNQTLKKYWSRCPGCGTPTRESGAQWSG